MKERPGHRPDQGISQKELDIDSVGERNRFLSRQALGVVAPASQPLLQALPLSLGGLEGSHYPRSQPGPLLLDEAVHAQLLPGRKAAPDIPLDDQLEPLCPHQAA